MIVQLILMVMATAAAAQNVPVSKLDLEKYSGKWHVIASIPTRFDKDWCNASEDYILKENGDYKVITAYSKTPDGELKTLESKAFPGSRPGELKQQFVWPFKVDYWVIEIADDYSYTVVGHPENKFLYIMSRSKTMDEKQLQAIIERCKAKGYDISELKRQVHTK